MTVLDPLAFVWLATIPALLLLYRLSRRSSVVLVSNLFLWRDSPERRPPRPTWRRMPWNIRLLLQGAFLLLVVIALAQPALPAGTPLRVAMIFDVSASMGVDEGGTTRMELARNRALAMFDALASPTEVLVIAAADRPMIAAESLTGHGELGDVLASLYPRPTASDLGAAYATAISMRPEAVPDVVWIFGDGAANAAPPAGVSTRFVQVGNAVDNIGITALAPRRNPFDASAHEALIEIFNGSPRSHSVPVRVLQDDRLLLNSTVQLAAAESRRLFVEFAASAGPLSASIDVRDRLSADNESRVPMPERAIDTLVVSADNPYLRTAVAAEPRFRAIHVTPDRYAAEGVPAGIDVTVLDGVLPVEADGGRYLILHPPAPAALRPARSLFAVDPTHPLVQDIDWGRIKPAAVTPLVSSADADVLVEADGHSILVAYRDGNTRVVTLGFDPRTPDFATTPAFPVFLSNALDWLSAVEAVGVEPTSPNPLDRAESDIRPVPLGRLADRAQEGAQRSGIVPVDYHRIFLLVALVVLFGEAGLAHARGDLLTPRAAGYARLATSLLIIAAVIGIPALPGGATRTVVWALDTSESVTDANARAALARVNAMSDAMSSTGRAGLVVFGERAFVAREPAARAPIDRLPPLPPGNTTDIGAGLRLAAALLTPDGGRVVLVSDGRENHGDARREARALWARGIPVDVLAINDADPESTSSGVSAEEIRAPAQVPVGRTFELTVGLRGRYGTPARVGLYREGSLESETDVVLDRDGRNEVTFSPRLDSGGLHAFTARVSAPSDDDPSDNESGAVVLGIAAPTALSVSVDGASAVVVDTLRNTGFAVRSLSPDAMPDTAGELATWDLIVLDDLSAADLSVIQERALSRYIIEEGGGLVLVGGPRSFGPAGFGGSSLESTLPIEIRPPDRIDRPPLAMVLVLDTSGSMALEERGVTKLDAAKDAVNSLLEVLDQRDRVGLVAFAETPRPLSPLRPVSERASIGDALADTDVGGGTVVAPALSLAYDWLEREASDKYVLLVSDGQIEDGVVGTMRPRFDDPDVELSVVGIGPDADWSRLEALAHAGGGRPYRADGAHQLAEILLREASLVSGKWLVERSVRLRPPRAHELLDGLAVNTLPHLHGYVAAVARAGADAVLESELGDPVLAAGRFGLGRSVTFTAPLSSAWMADVTPTPEFAELWARVLDWSARKLYSDVLHPAIERRGNDAMLTLDAVDPHTGFIDELTVTGVLQEPDGELIDLTLLQTGPGRYEGSFDLSRAGTYRLRLDARRSRVSEPISSGGSGAMSVQLGVHVARSAEHSRSGADFELLRDISEITGGRLITDDAELFPPGQPRRDRARKWRTVAILALLGLLVEVALRRGVIPATLLRSFLPAGALRNHSEIPPT